MYRNCTIGPFGSGFVGATAETPTVLRSSLRNFGHDRLVGRRIRRVGGIVRVRIRCGYTDGGSIHVDHNRRLVTVRHTSA